MAVHLQAGLMAGHPLSAGLVFAFAAIVALVSSFVLVSRLERLAGRWRLPEAALGLVVALAADSPEITSAISASAHGQRSIGAGIVLGSNVFNLAALLGLGAIVARRVVLHRRVVLLEGAVGIWVALVSVVVVGEGRGAALGLVAVLVVVAPYLALALHPQHGLLKPGFVARAANWLRAAIAEEEGEISEGIRPAPPGRHDGLVALISIALVVGSSTLMERAAETLGKSWQLSPLIVGGVVLAAVTSLPNAVGAVFLATRGRGAAVLSEVMNSNMLNVVTGLLLPAAFVGLGGPGSGSVLVAAWYAGLTVVSLLIAYSGRGVSRPKGVIIVAGYAAFLVVAATR